MSKELPGPWGPPVRVRVERTPVGLFARAVTDRNPVYRDQRAASAAGFAAIPCPPTFTFAMTHGGAWADLQPEGGSGSFFDSDSVLAELGGGGGLYLHGEQEFVYHRQPVVGDELEGRMRMADRYDKQGGRGVMEFTVIETEWRDVTTGEPVVTERTISIHLPGG
jgi:acyl dehydratase